MALSWNTFAIKKVLDIEFIPELTSNPLQES